MTKHLDSIGGPFFLGGMLGFVWATGLYKLWRPLLKALAFYLRFVR